MPQDAGANQDTCVSPETSEKATNMATPLGDQSPPHTSLHTRTSPTSESPQSANEAPCTGDAQLLQSRGAWETYREDITWKRVSTLHPPTHQDASDDARCLELSHTMCVTYIEKQIQDLEERTIYVDLVDIPTKTKKMWKKIMKKKKEDMIETKEVICLRFTRIED